MLITGNPVIKIYREKNQMAGEKDEIVPCMQEMRNVYKIIFAKLKGFSNLVTR